MNNTKDWTRVALYGTFDGFTYSTDDLPKTVVILDGGESVEIPNGCVISADQIVKKDEIKLRDVIKRIKYFDLVTQAVWINGILNELGSSYGLHKYHEGYKQGKLEGALEREKVTIPQRIDEFITEQKKLGHTLSYSIDACMPDQVAEWYWDNSELFVRAWLDGYEVEQEKRYLVKVNAENCSTKYLVFGEITGSWFFAHDKYGNVIIKHTRKELEQAGFGWVFSCEGIEVDEVEG